MPTSSIRSFAAHEYECQRTLGLSSVPQEVTATRYGTSALGRSVPCMELTATENSHPPALFVAGVDFDYSVSSVPRSDVRSLG
jgi:hypothetical protein